ncbi:MAG: ABC transporter permease [Thermoplasmata archaeon]|nr:ABC transporter permease [Thermoplasmata archaeon]
MRINKAWIVSKKDMAEFKTHKYIMFSIVFMPTIMGVIIPLGYFLPIQLFAGDDGGAPLDINLTVVTEYEYDSLSDQTFFDASFSHMMVEDSIIESSYVSNSTLISTVVNNSETYNVTFVNCVITRSNIHYPQALEGTVVSNSVIIRDENPEVVLITLQMLSFILFFYMMIPAVVPTFIASYSFIGEKNNRSLEPLLATPTTDMELFVGKTLAIFLVTMAATWVAYIVSAVIVNILAFPLLGYYPLPNGLWIVGFLLLAPIFCILSISVNVLISSKVTDVRASQQIGGLVVLPVLMFVFLTFAGPAFSSPWMMIVYSIAFLAVDMWVVYFSVRIFNREEILTTWK